MSAFEKVKLKWDGEEYIFQPDMDVGCQIEDVIRFAELSKALQSVNPPFMRLSKAYGIMLRHAGCQVKDVEVYTAMFGVDTDNKEAVYAACISLLMAFTPKDAMRKVMDEGSKKSEAPQAADT